MRAAAPPLPGQLLTGVAEGGQQQEVQQQRREDSSSSSSSSKKGRRDQQQAALQQAVWENTEQPARDTEHPKKVLSNVTKAQADDLFAGGLRS